MITNSHMKIFKPMTEKHSSFFKRLYEANELIDFDKAIDFLNKNKDKLQFKKEGDKDLTDGILMTVNSDKTEITITKAGKTLGKITSADYDSEKEPGADANSVVFTPKNETDAHMFIYAID